MGDWIVILLDDEYEGPKRHVSHSCGSFQKFLFDFLLKDIGFVGQGLIEGVELRWRGWIGWHVI